MNVSKISNFLSTSFRGDIPLSEMALKGTRDVHSHVFEGSLYRIVPHIPFGGNKMLAILALVCVGFEIGKISRP
jgi:hypothetical protein